MVLARAGATSRLATKGMTSVLIFGGGGGASSAKAMGAAKMQMIQNDIARVLLAMEASRKESILKPTGFNFPRMLPLVKGQELR